MWIIPSEVLQALSNIGSIIPKGAGARPGRAPAAGVAAAALSAADARRAALRSGLSSAGVHPRPRWPLAMGNLAHVV